jgi:hypothetical protein
MQKTQVPRTGARVIMQNDSFKRGFLHMLRTGETYMSQVQTQTQVSEKTFLVWQKHTWGSFGQHHNIYTFVIDLERREQVPIFQLVTVRHEISDSRKNIHRYTYVSQSEMRKLVGKVLKQVEDYASSSKRVVTVTYYIVKENGELAKLEYETGLRDERGWFDRVYLPGGKVLIVRREEVEVQ